MLPSHWGRCVLNWKRWNVNGALLSVHGDLMCLWDWHICRVYCYFFAGKIAKDSVAGRRLYFPLSWVKDTKNQSHFNWHKFYLVNSYIVLLLLVNLNLFTFCYFHSAQPVLHHPCSYCRTVIFYFVYVFLQLCLAWSVVFILWCRICIVCIC